ncbi:MAG: sigma-70 family RNA polymerase sigma factor [Planctomycetes bacterium]|nr:sigma-70 family RNA polymerase sigma factor [Planctomycetota bacterium]
MEQTPQSLLNRLAADPHDPVAWGRLDQLYTPFLRGLLSRFVPAQEVDDVFQEVHVIVLRKIGEFAHNTNPGAFRRWLRTIVAFKVREHRRRRRVERPDDQLDALEDDSSAISRLIDREHDEHVFRVLCAAARGAFPDRWNVFREYAIDGAPANEVAARNGVSVGAVYKAKSDILAWLRREGTGLIETQE